mmetsp:Transcript_11917/g.32543  ORF Transcript_11917/g.32543 Transcript_11917/m.32543 type:complete len:238 (-) Transcript_11917:1215-1928(-)
MHLADQAVQVCLAAQAHLDVEQDALAVRAGLQPTFVQEPSGNLEQAVQALLVGGKHGAHVGLFHHAIQVGAHLGPDVHAFVVGACTQSSHGSVLRDAPAHLCQCAVSLGSQKVLTACIRDLASLLEEHGHNVIQLPIQLAAQGNKHLLHERDGILDSEAAQLVQSRHRRAHKFVQAWAQHLRVVGYDAAGVVDGLMLALPVQLLAVCVVGLHHLVDGRAQGSLRLRQGHELRSTQLL